MPTHNWLTTCRTVSSKADPLEAELEKFWGIWSVGGKVMYRQGFDNAVRGLLQQRRDALDNTSGVNANGGSDGN